MPNVWNGFDCAVSSDADAEPYSIKLVVEQNESDDEVEQFVRAKIR